MEWCIPIQTFQVENVHLGNTPQGQKPTISFVPISKDILFSAFWAPYNLVMLFTLMDIVVDCYLKNTDFLLDLIERR